MIEAKNSDSKGDLKRMAILDLSVDLASLEGLEGLTIGRLSKLMGMSKSGLFAHFGSKEDLQVATVRHAQDQFREHVWDRVDEVEAGISRLRFMLHTWIEHIEYGGLRGGCFFSGASTEFDGRPGEVRDRLATLIRSWVGYLEKEISEAQSIGEVTDTVAAELLAFQLHAYVQEANLYRQLFQKENAFDLARASIDEKLFAVATALGAQRLRYDIND